MEDQEAKELIIARAAYLKVAKKRFMDNVHSVLHQDFLMEFLGGVKDALQLSDKQLERTMAESEPVKHQRRMLQEKKETLTDAEELLLKFMGSV
jgi:hypothetical protein